MEIRSRIGENIWHWNRNCDGWPRLNCTILFSAEHPGIRLCERCGTCR